MGTNKNTRKRWWSIIAFGCLGVSNLLGNASGVCGGEPAYTVLTPEPAPVVRGANPAPEMAPAPKQSPAPAQQPAKAPAPQANVLGIDLPTALRLVNTSNPTIALARERVQEAYYRLRQAEFLWLPTLQTGPAYTRHDGRIQNSTGLIFSTSKQSFFEGGGAVLSVASSDALFGPLIARQLLRAMNEYARGVRDQVQEDVALTYLDLLQAYGALAVNAETLSNVRIMTTAARSAINRGSSKTGADLNRALTELNFREEERINLEGQAAVVSARLAQLLLLEPSVDLRPMDPAVVPVTLVPETGVPFDQLVATAWRYRPELAQSRFLAGAALTTWRQAQWSPLFPRVEAAYNAGTFGGGLNEAMSQFGSRGDGSAQLLWELPGLGAGYLATTRVQRSLFNQATIHVTEIQAQVAAEVVGAAKDSLARRLSLRNAEESVRQAEEMWTILYKGSFGLAGGRFDPLEPLLAEQALNQARMQYLTQVIEYNKAQFRLYRAMGQPPLAALPKATSVPVAVPVAPRPLGPPPQAVVGQPPVKPK